MVGTTSVATLFFAIQTLGDENNDANLRFVVYFIVMEAIYLNLQMVFDQLLSQQ